MFEEVQTKESENSSRLWIGSAIVAVLAVAGIAFFSMSKPAAQSPAATTARRAATPNAEADPVHDLKVLRATMAKDSLGTTAVWSLTIENRSSVYTYSDIQYSTNYLGADGKPVRTNTGTIATSIDPGEQYKSDLRDTLYPAGTAYFNFVITGAKSKSQ